MCVCVSEYVIEDKADKKYDAHSIIERNATTLFLTELFRGERDGM